MAKKKAAAQARNKTKAPFVVGTGAPAGGLKSLQEFFGNMRWSVNGTDRADDMLPSRELAHAIHDADSQAAQRNVDLEFDLLQTKENLQATIAELKTTNEELQSVNEELYSVNSEFESKIGELTSLNNDMDNLLQSTDIGAIFLNRELRIRKFTPAITRVIKLLEHDIGRPLDQIANGIEMDHDELRGHVQGVLDSGKHFECDVNSRGGVPLLMRIDPFRDEKGRTDGVVLTFVDISALKRAEMQSRLLQTLMHAISSSTDFDAAMESTLSSVCQMFGWDYAEAWLPQNDEGTLKCCSTFIARPDLAPFQSIRSQLKLASGAGLPGRVWSSKEPQWVLDLRKETELILHADVATGAGLTSSMSVPVLVSAKDGLKSAVGIPILAENDVEVVLTFFMGSKPGKRDLKSVVELLSPVGAQLGTVVQRKRLDAALHEAYLVLQQKNEQMEQFVHTVSHDLKSPLVSIGGVLGMLKEELRDGQLDEADEMIITGENTVARMQGLIDDLLKLSRLGRSVSDVQLVDLKSMIEEVIQSHKSTIDEQSVTIALSLEVPCVQVDRNRLAEVLDNLLVNALKYACDGPQPRIEVGSCPAEGEVRLFVRDFGQGIDPQQFESIFELFQQLDPSREGSGVGLAIVRRVMEVHHGRAWVESGPDEGATFWLAFPQWDGNGGLTHQGTIHG